MKLFSDHHPFAFGAVSTEIIHPFTNPAIRAISILASHFISSHEFLSSFFTISSDVMIEPTSE